MKIFFFVILDASLIAARLKRTFQIAGAMRLSEHTEVEVCLLSETDRLELGDKFDEYNVSFRTCSVPRILRPFLTLRIGLLENLIYGGLILFFLLKNLKLSEQSKISDVYIYGESLLLHLPAFFLRRFYKYKLWCDLVEYLERSKKRIFNPGIIDHHAFINVLAKRYDHVIGISDFWENFLEEKGFRGNFHLVRPMASNMSKSVTFESAPRCRKDGKLDVIRILYIGFLIQRELPDAMADCLQALSASGVNWRFTVCGITEETFYNRLPSLKKFDDSISVLGSVKEEEKLEQLQIANFGFLLNDDTRTSRASAATRIPEYIQSGTILISSGAAPFDGILLQEGLIVHSDCSNDLGSALCDGILKVINDEKLESIALKNEKYARKNLHWKSMNSELFKHLNV